MANPSWFIEEDYLASKLAQLKALGLGDLYTNTTQVKAAIEGAGLTAFDHFQQFHTTEGTSPNKLFNAFEYLTAKAAKLNADNVDGGPWDIAKVDAAFKAAGLSAWQHYQQFGWDEGVNPSNAFDTNAYLAAKAAQLNTAGVEGGPWTADKVKEAFKNAGTDPVSHYEANGKAESVAAAPVAADKRVQDDPLKAGSNNVLTADPDQTIIGTAQNDTVIAATVAALQGDKGHTLVDTTPTDRDVIKVTAAEKEVKLDGKTSVAGFEVLDVTWADYANASVDLTGFNGLQELHLAVNKTGNLGDATITKLNNATVVLGTGVTGTVTVEADANAGGTILTGIAKSVTFTEGTADKGAATVTGGAEVETITVGNFENATVTAGAKTTTVTAGGTGTKNVNVTTSAATATVNATGAAILVDATTAKADIEVSVIGTAGTTDSAKVTLGDNGKVSASSLDGANDVLTLDVAAGKTVTLAGTAAAKTVVSGSGDVTIKAGQTLLNGATIAKSTTGTLTVEAGTVTDVDAFNVQKIAADNIKLTSNDATLIVKNDQKLEVANDGTAGKNLTVSGGTAPADTANKSVNIKLTSAEYGAVAFDGANLKTLNLEAAANLKLTSLAGVAGKSQSVVIKNTGDVTITGTVSNLKSLDASGVAGKLTANAANAIAAGTNVQGSVGDNDVTFANVTESISFVGQGGNDKVVLGAVSVAKQASLVLGEGNNSVEAGAVAMAGTAIGVLSVTAGGGNDTVTLAGESTGTIVLELGGGTNTLKLDGADLKAVNNLVLGGVNTLEVNGTANVISAKYLTEASYTLKGAGYSGHGLTVQGTADGDTINLSTWTVSDSNSTGAKITVEGLGGNDTITGTSIGDVIIGGAGADVLTGGGGEDIFSFGSSADTFSGVIADGTADRITDFKTGEDQIAGLGVAGSAAGEFTSVAGADGSTFADALAAANAVFAGENDQSYFATSFGKEADGNVQTVLFLNIDNNAVADGIILVGQANNATHAAAIGQIVAADIIA